MPEKRLKKNVWQDLPKPLIYLAPMSGITNLPYRTMVKRYHSDIVFPEFVSIHAMHYGSDRTFEMLEYDEAERPIIAQVFGSTPEYFYEAAKKCKELGFDGVDINFGCPAPKVAKNGGGCALLGDLEKSKAVIQACIDAVGQDDELGEALPVSVKTRVSYKNTHVRDFTKLVMNMDVAALCIHGRSFEKPYEGASDLECIKEAVEMMADTDTVVLSSGHAHTPEAAKETLDFTGCDGVALARGTFGRPWVGKQIKDYLETGSYTEPTQAEKLDIMVEHARLAAEHSNRPFVEMRKVLAWYIKGIPHAASYRRQLVRVQSIDDVKSVVAEIRGTM